MSHSRHHNQPPARAQWATHLPDEAATLRLGARIAACLAPGMRVYLRGDLGSGKTTLVRGMLRALGYPGRVKSPTYTLVELYVLSRLNLYHFDFYRFHDPKEWSDAGLDEHFDSNSVCVVEWPERAGAALPSPDLEIELARNESGRDADIHAFSASGEQCLTQLQEG